MYRIYQIENENSLMEIANKFNTTEEQLKKINGIMDNYIVRSGGFIIVPTSETKQNENFMVYKVKQGDNLYSIARSYNTDYKQLMDLNGLDKDQYLYINQEILVPRDNVLFKITKENDTLNDVAKSFDTNVDEILKQNTTIYLNPEQLIVYKKRD